MRAPLRHAARALILCIACLCFATAARAADAARFEAGTLWKIERAGSPPSYLFGTLHHDDERVLTLAPAVQRAFDGAQVFAIELVADEDATRRFRRAMVRKEPLLSELMPPEDYLGLDTLLGTHGMPKDARAHLKPWAALIVLVQPVEPPGIILDRLLLLEAEKRKLRVEPLETIDEQIAALADLPEPTQLTLLRHAMTRHDELQQSFAPLVKAYLAQDLRALFELNAQAMAAAPGSEVDTANARFLDALLYQRNARFAQRLEPLLAKGRVFAAFGAMHLYGPRGVPALLEARGYKVTRVR